MKNYNFLEVTTIYSVLLDKLYEGIGDGASYSDLMNIILKNDYFESNYIERYLISELHNEAEIIFYNNTTAQNRWDDNPDKAPFNIFVRQLKAFNPDILLISAPCLFSPGQIRVIRDAGKKGMKLICFSFTVFNHSLKKVLSYYDMCLTGSSFHVKMLSRYNGNTRLLRHAFEPSILEKTGTKEKIIKPAFIGSIITGDKYHTNRIDMLGKLDKAQIQYDFYGHIYGSWRERVLRLSLPKEIRMLRKQTEKHLKEIMLPSQFGLNYYRTLSSYIININSHTPVAGTGCGNMRMFEVTGVGSCLVTDYKEENALLFEEDNEIVVYRNDDELVGKLKYLLSHPEEVSRIAANGQKKTVNNYTYKNKALQLDSYIQELL